MKERVLWVVVGVGIGLVGSWGFFSQSKPARAANDRFEDFVLCTGPVAVWPGAQTDGVWLLDYKSGTLLGTVIERNSGKIFSWAEVNLVNEFGIAPKQDVHFMMTTGSITRGQAALYVAETTTGKFAVYTMSVRPDGLPGITIRRNDQGFFRAPSKE